MVAHVSPDVTSVPAGALPAKPRYVAAIGPAGVAERNCEVSYHALLVAVVLLGLVSYAKKANSRSFRIGPPKLPPHWLNRAVSRSGAPTLVPFEVRTAG